MALACGNMLEVILSGRVSGAARLGPLGHDGRGRCLCLEHAIGSPTAVVAGLCLAGDSGAGEQRAGEVVVHEAGTLACHCPFDELPVVIDQPRKQPQVHDRAIACGWLAVKRPGSGGSMGVAGQLVLGVGAAPDQDRGLRQRRLGAQPEALLDPVASHPPPLPPDRGRPWQAAAQLVRGPSLPAVGRDRPDNAGRSHMRTLIG